MAGKYSQGEPPIWKPDYTTTEKNFYGWGGSAVEEALAGDFLHNLEMARGKRDLTHVLGIISRAYAEKYDGPA